MSLRSKQILPILPPVLPSCIARSSFSASTFPNKKNTNESLFYYPTLSWLDPRNFLRDFLLFDPSTKLYPIKEHKGIRIEDIFIKTRDGEILHGLFLEKAKNSDKITIYFHGNDLNVSRWYTAPVAIQEKIPANFLMVDYRGYGKSTGRPTFQGIVLDALATYDYLISMGYKPHNISVYGRSLGGAAALELASRVKVRATIVQSSITSFRDLIKVHYPWIPSLLIKNNLFNLKELIKKVADPVFICHGDSDKIAPPRFANELFHAANEPKTLHILKGAGHANVGNYFDEEYFRILKELIA